MGQMTRGSSLRTNLTNSEHLNTRNQIIGTLWQSKLTGCQTSALQMAAPNAAKDRPIITNEIYQKLDTEKQETGVGTL
jgi:hypothetical protein